MCQCINEDRANAWDAVYDLLVKHNPTFSGKGSTGLKSALIEIERLQQLDIIVKALTKAAQG